MHEVKRYGDVVEWQWSTDNELLPKPFWTSCYLVDGLLIDSGAPGGAGELQAFVEALVPEDAARACVLTHAHEDHAGGGKYLSEELGIPVYINEKALKMVHAGYTYPDYRQLTWGEQLFPAPMLQPLPDSPMQTPGGKFIFELFPMPGHAPCLVALIEREQQWAFVADAVQPKYQMIFGPNSPIIIEDIGGIYSSLQNLADYTRDLTALKLFIAGHGMVENGPVFLAEKIAEIDSLHHKAHELSKQGLSERKILRALLGGESFVGGFSRGALSRLNFLQGLLAWPLE